MTFYGTRDMWDETISDERKIYHDVVLFDSDEEFQLYLNENLKEPTDEDIVEHPESFDSAPIGAPYHDE